MIIKGKTVILTGVRRIGQTVAEELAKKGANLAITYRSSKEGSEAMCTACLQLVVKAVPFQSDLSKEEDIKKMVENVKDQFGRIDGLVHMAANYPRATLNEVSMENFIKTQQIIAGSALLLAKHVAPELQTNPEDQIKGKIIFFSDWSVLKRPYPEYLNYNMAKSGIDSLTKALAIQLAPHITVNAIAPGPILRPSDLSEEENQEAMGRTPLKRWGGAQEIAKAVLYLLDADFVTGFILPVDGGRTIG